MEKHPFSLWNFLCAEVKTRNSTANSFGLENLECFDTVWVYLEMEISVLSNNIRFRLSVSCSKGKTVLVGFFFPPVGNHGDSVEEMILRETGDEMGPLTRLLPALMRFINNIGGHVIAVFSLVDNLCTLGPPLGLQLS